MFKTTTYKQALKDNEISREILVYPSQRLLVTKNGVRILATHTDLKALYNTTQIAKSCATRERERERRRPAI